MALRRGWWSAGARAESFRRAGSNSAPAMGKMGVAVPPRLATGPEAAPIMNGRPIPAIAPNLNGSDANAKTGEARAGRPQRGSMRARDERLRQDGSERLSSSRPPALLMRVTVVTLHILCAPRRRGVHTHTHMMHK